MILNAGLTILRARAEILTGDNSLKNLEKILLRVKESFEIMNRKNGTTYDHPQVTARADFARGQLFFKSRVSAPVPVPGVNAVMILKSSTQLNK